MKDRKLKKTKYIIASCSLAFATAAVVCGYSNPATQTLAASETSCATSDHLHQFSVEGDTLTISATGTNKIISYSCGLTNFLTTNSSVSKVIISEGFTEISSNAFFNCKNITNVVIPSSISLIENHAFENCYFLSNVEFKGTTAPTISSYSFNLTSSKGTITVPVGAVSNYQSAFSSSFIGLTFDENHWVIKEYSDAPKFNDGFENKNLTSESYTVGNEYTVHDDVKYKFGGWFEDKYYTGQAVTSFNNNTTYYAKWINSFGNTVVTTSVNFKKTPASTLPTGSNIVWNSENNIVTLNNVTIDTKEQVGLNLPANSTVTVSGDNTVRALGNGDINNKKCAGIYSDQVGTLTITGNGNLNAYGGNLVKDVNDYELNSARVSAGTFANGNISISNINFHSESGKTDCEESTSYNCGLSHGIFSTSKISIDNATVTAVGGDGTVTTKKGFSNGIHAYNNIEINESVVNASSGYAKQDSDAIFAGWSVNASDSITAYGPNDIFLANVIVNKSTVTAISGTTTDYDTIGIYAHNNITFKDSTVVAKNSGSKGSATEHGETRAAGIFHNEDLVIDNSKVTVEAYGTGIYTYTHADEVDQGKTAVFGRTDIKNNSNVSIKTLDNDGAALTACNRLLVANSTLKCDVKTHGNTGVVFNDPNHDASNIEGLVITGNGKIISNGVVKVEETDTNNPYKFGNETDKHYYVSNSGVEYLNGTTNVVTPNEGSIMIIGFAYDVTFNANGHGTAPSSQKVFAGDSIAKPTDPTQDGYKFDGWYKDAECTQAWNFDTDVVSGNITLYAKWTNVLVSNLWWIITLCVILLLLIIYIVCYFALYRRGKLDEKKIRVIYKWLPRGNKGKETK